MSALDGDQMSAQLKAFDLEAPIVDRFMSFHHYWAGLCKQGELIPHRKTLTPAIVAPVLADIAILDRSKPDSLEVVFQGTGFETFMTVELTGANLFEMQSPHTKDAFIETFNQMQHFPCACIMVESRSWRKSESRFLTFFHFPLADDDGICRSFLTTFYSRSMKIRHMGKGHAPGWLEKNAIFFLDIGYGCPDPITPENYRTLA